MVCCCLAATLVACPDLSGLSSGGLTDAGSSGGIEGGLGDAAQGDGASLDANLAADAARTPCASPHAFCDDFEVSSIAERWTSRDVDTGGRVEQSTARAAQGSRSLSVYLPAQPGDGVFRTASVRKAFEMPWRHALVDVDMWLEPVATNVADKGSGLLSWYYQAKGDGGANIQKGVYFTVLGSRTFIGVTDDPAPGSQPKFPENRWVHVHLDVDPTSSVEVTVEGSQWLKTSVKDKWLSGGTPTMFFVLGVIGYAPDGSSPAYSVYYDNAVVDFVD